MIDRRFSALVLLACGIHVLRVGPVWGQAPEGLSAFVDGAAAEIAASPLKIPQFESAQFESVESLGAVNGIDRYLCWLKNEQGRMGYLAVDAYAESFHVVALSAALILPDYFLKHMTSAQLADESLDLSKATDIGFTENVPLVVTAQTMLGTESIEISELAASLASVLLHMQYQKGVLLFGHRLSPMELDRNHQTQGTKSPDWQTATEECHEAIKSEVVPRDGTAEQRSAAMMRQRALAKPIIRRRLLAPVDSRERLEILQLEWKSIVNPARRDISKGMVNALLLQMDYLGKTAATVKQDIALFLKTRGQTARIEIVPFKQPRKDSLPAILLGPDGIAGVVLGSVHIDDELFVWVFFPKTGGALVRTLAEERAKRRPPRSEDPEYEAKFQAGVREIEEAEAKLREAYAKRGISLPQPEKSAEERLREGQKRLESHEKQTKTVRDKNSTLGESIRNGIHLVNCSHLASWEVVYISEVKTGDD